MISDGEFILFKIIMQYIFRILLKINQRLYSFIMYLIVYLSK